MKAGLYNQDYQNIMRGDIPFCHNVSRNKAKISDHVY
jgi:hypothetical protein